MRDPGAPGVDRAMRVLVVLIALLLIGNLLTCEYHRRQERKPGPLHRVGAEFMRADPENPGRIMLDRLRGSERSR